MVSLAQIREVPLGKMLLLVGPPGAGKTTFCQNAALQSLAMDKPIIFVTTEYGPAEAERALKEQGLREIKPDLLNFVNVYHETVGLSVSERPDTVHAHCEDLSSISIAIAKLSERIGKGILLVFDSLTSPYLFSGSEILRFMRMTLSGFAAEGNAVLTCIDEGCGKSEDIVAMMSLSQGVIRMIAEDGRRVLKVLKHPIIEPAKIAVPGAKIPEKLWDMKRWEEKIMEFPLQAMKGGALAALRKDLGNYVSLFWSNLAHWSCILWDPKGFPEIEYEMSKKHGESMKEMMEAASWHQRMLFQAIMPKSLSKVKDMKKLARVFQKMLKPMRGGIFEYLGEASKAEEHYCRIYESAECWGFENVGGVMAHILPASCAGMCKGLESWRGLDRDWNAVETKCIGLGDPFCEFKVVPGVIPELNDSLRKESPVVDKMRDQLMSSLMGFLLEGKPLVGRPSGSDVMLSTIMHVMVQPALAGERYRMVLRMAGAKAGKEVGEHLLEAGIAEDAAVKRFLNFLEYCKVGKVTLGETIRMKENCESVFYKFMTKKQEEPTCYFTTGFINGFFSTIRNQHVKETKCIAMGDPYCEWEFR